MTLPNLVGPWVDVRSFAPPETPRDGKTPWHEYIQAGVDYLVGLATSTTPPGSAGTLYLPPGNYLIDEPIRIAKVLNGAYTFCSINIMGDAPPYGGGQFHGSSIFPSYTDKPAVIVQCGRAVRIENLAISGKNTWTAEHSVTIDTLYSDGNFLATGVTDCSRHAPYAGICIDPFCWPKPADSYPGLDAHYVSSGSGRSGSSSISVERCHIQGFVVGIAISPNQFLVGEELANTQNAENIIIDACNIQSTKSAIAICQDQSRHVTCRNLVVVYAKYVIDCTHYGKGTGPCPSIFGADIGWVKHIFSTASFGSGAVIDGLYCEGVLSVGVLGGGGAHDGYVFNGCAFNLMCSASRPTINHHLVNLARATFNACSLSVVTATTTEAVPIWIYGGGPMSFRDCVIGLQNYPDNSLPFWINGSSQNVVFDNTMLVEKPFGTWLSRILATDYMGNIYNQTVLPGCFVYPLRENISAPQWVAGGQREIPLGDASTTKLAIAPNGTATFVAPTSGIIVVGDLIYLRKSYVGTIESYPATPSYPVMGKVVEVNPDTGVATMKWIPEYVVTGPTPGVGDRMFVAGFYKMHSATTGTVTKGSRLITDVSTTNASSWIAGDRIRDDGHLVPADTYVMAYDSVAATITLSREVTAATPPGGTLVRLYDAELRAFASTQVY
jgi:hypothetical protein